MPARPALRHRPRRRLPLVASAAVASAIAVAALVVPCRCPDHRGAVVAVSGLTGPPPAAAHAGMAMAPNGSATSGPAVVQTPAAIAAPRGHAIPMTGMPAAAHSAPAFEVGTAERPLVAKGPEGPLWKPTPPSPVGRTRHGTFAAQTVAAQLARVRGTAAAVVPHDALVASRAALTTTQATKRLSKRCQRLIKRRSSRLSKADRRRRSACLRRRRALSEASQQPTVIGVSGPAPTVQGPSPTTPTGDPAATTPVATTPAPTTPKGPTYGSIGVTAIDGTVPFRLTRGTVTADIVNFELDNTDRQQHDLSIAPTDAAGQINGPVTTIIGLLAPGTHAYADVTLKPGRYKVLCTVEGHGAMAVNITVVAPVKP